MSSRFRSTYSSAHRNDIWPTVSVGQSLLPHSHQRIRDDVLAVFRENDSPLRCRVLDHRIAGKVWNANCVRRQGWQWEDHGGGNVRPVRGRARSAGGRGGRRHQPAPRPGPRPRRAAPAANGGRPRLAQGPPAGRQPAHRIRGLNDQDDAARPRIAAGQPGPGRRGAAPVRDPGRRRALP